jgi:NAD+ diphosphatase
VNESTSIAAQLRSQSRRVDLGPRPHLGYTASPLERVAERRTDAAFLADLESRLDAGAYAIGGEMVVLRKGGSGLDPLFPPAEVRALAPARETVFLGLLGKAGRFGIGLDQAAAEALKSDPDFVVTDLRSIAVQGLVAPEHLPPLAEAKAMLHWHARHRFCANCGAPSQLVCGGWKRECPACKVEHFPRTDPVAIMLAIDGDRCLLGRQARFVPNMWSCLAGFVEPGESIEDAVRRETQEEAGIACGRVAYLASQPWPFPMNLIRRGDFHRDRGRSFGTGGRPLVRSRRGRRHADAAAPGPACHAAAGRHRAPHHPRLARSGWRCLALGCRI